MGCRRAVRACDSAEEFAAGKNGILLATFEEGNAGLVQSAPAYPIYSSEDMGKTWKRIAEIRETEIGLNSEWNPNLYELPQDVGGLKKGTILCAGISIDPAHVKKTAISLYKSEDAGNTWEKIATVATGGGLKNGIYEPFLMLDEKEQLICYYSDETQAEKHSQKIVCKRSEDGLHWGNAVDVVASDNPEHRPGMPVLTKMGNGSYFMTYEVVGIDGNPIHYKTSDDGLNWGDVNSIGTKLKTNGGKALGSASYCGWTPAGSDKGTLIVSATFMGRGKSQTGTDYFISHDYGNSWVAVPHPLPYTDGKGYAYSNSFSFSADGKTLFAINNVDDKADKAKISFALVELGQSVSSATACASSTAQGIAIGALASLFWLNGILRVFAIAVGGFIFWLCRTAIL
ncbi:MAG: glycoside hydrolase [Oscillospiraceae bacterium]|nr:glycoside hydrolase [Oscillospiraceae bacterium]